MSLIKGTGAGDQPSTGFFSHTLDQSLRFNDNDSASLTRTPGSASNQRTWTWSAWVKRSTLGNNYFTMFSAKDSSLGNYLWIQFTSSADDQINIYNYPASDSFELTTNQLFRDTNGWYHIVVAVDTTNGTAGNRVKLYVNGERVTSFATESYPAEDYQTAVNRANLHSIGSYDNGSYYFDGYMAEVNFVDGTALTPSSFGETKDGIWISKEYSGSYGTNGFYLKFVSGAIGTDSSGNGNNWTHSTGNASRNRTVQDSPTNNFNVIPSTNTALLTHEHQGMRINTARTGHWDGVTGGFSVKSGKWYYEVQLNVGSGDLFRSVVGWKQAPEEAQKVFNRLGASGDPFGTGSGDLGNTGHYAYQSWNTQFYGNGGYTGTSISASSGDVINVAVDFDNNKIYFGKNGTYIANDGGTDGNPANGTNESLSGLYNNGKFYSPSVVLRSDNTAGSNSTRCNFGSDRSFGANLALGTAYADENGYGEFRYPVPSGFLTLCSQNLSEPEIIDGSEHFNTVLYTGNSSTRSIIGVGFSPDWTWIKQRNAAENHFLTDSVRGAGLHLRSDAATAESDSSATFTSFDADGFSLTGTGSAAPQVNDNNDTYVSWNWLAGTAFSNSAGASGATIASSGQANTTAGFSIIKYTGNGATGATVAHGLSSALQFYIIKNRDAGFSWTGYHEALGAGNYIQLDSTGAATSTNDWNSTAPTSSVFTVSGDEGRINKNGTDYIAYCFHSVEGYLKIGSYSGNSNADGPFIHTGFKPAWIMLKESGNARNWVISYDDATYYNGVTQSLFPNITQAEDANVRLDFLSNGFKLRTTSTSWNNNGGTYIYLAFAEQPFKYSNAR